MFIPGQTVQSFDEVVCRCFVLLHVLQQGSGSVNHITGQEAILEAKVYAKRLDTNVFHAEDNKCYTLLIWHIFVLSDYNITEMFTTRTQIYWPIPQ